MPLYCAAHWIATKGGKQDFDPRDVERWKWAYGELMARLSSEEVRVVGKREGVSEVISGVHFVGCPVDYPFQELDVDPCFGREMYLVSYPYIGEEEWKRGLDNSLGLARNPGGVVSWSTRLESRNTGRSLRSTTVARQKSRQARREGHPSCIYYALNWPSAANLEGSNQPWQLRFGSSGSGSQSNIQNHHAPLKRRPKTVCEAVIGQSGPPEIKIGGIFGCIYRGQPSVALKRSS